MLGTIKAGVKALAEFLGIVSWFQRWFEAERNREMGRKDASLDAHKEQVENVTKAKRAAARVRTDDDLKRRVRKRYSPK